VRHEGADIAKLFETISKYSTDVADVWIGIETPHGALVDAALDRGFSVFTINPKQVDRFRDRYYTSGKKDDKTDAYVLARTVLSDTDCFRRLEIAAPEYVQLREWSRQRESLVTDQTRLLHRIKGALRRYYPSFLELKVLDSTFGRALFRAAPSPQKAARMRLDTIEKLLRTHRIRRLRAEQVRDTLRKPPLFARVELTEAITAQIQHSYAHLDVVQQQIAQCEVEIERLVSCLHTAHVAQQEHLPNAERTPSDIEIWSSLDGVGKVVLGTVLAEAHLLIASRDLESLRALSGCAPVTRNTGQRENRYAPRKSSIVHMRRACSEHLRNAVYHLGRVASVFSPVYKPRYAAMRARGHSHGRACRQIADQILHVAFAMLRDRTLYDRHHARPAPAAA
jgi:transposase